MANNRIQIKRSTSNATVSGLSNGELAFTQASNTLHIGLPDGSGVLRIGGAQYPGVLTNSHALVANASGEIDKIITANAVITKLVANGSPGSAGQVVVSNGTGIYWGTGTSGANTYVQFNDSGVANGVAGFTFDKATNTLFVADSITIGTEYISNDTSIFLGNSTTNTLYSAYGNQFSITSDTGANTFYKVSGVTGNTTFINLIDQVSSLSNTVAQSGTQTGSKQELINATSYYVNTTIANTTGDLSTFNANIEGGFVRLFTSTKNFSSNTIHSANVYADTTGSVIVLAADTPWAVTTLQANQTQLGIGNTTVNAAINASAFFVTGNSSTLGTAVYNSNGVALGNVTSTAAPVVSMANSTGNSILRVTSLNLAGNSTTLANVFVSGNGVSVGNGSVTASPTLYIANSTGNTTVAVASLTIAGNSTTLAPVSVTGNGVVIGNNSSTAAPAINIANSSGNTVLNVNAWTLSNSTANILIANNGGWYGNNGTVVFVGNSTVNATHNSSSFFVTGNTTTLATVVYNSNGVVAGNSSVTAAPIVSFANTVGNVVLRVTSLNFAGNSTTLANAFISGNGVSIGNTSVTASPIIYIANTTEQANLGVNYFTFTGNATTLAPVTINGNGASFGTTTGTASPTITLANTTGNTIVRTFDIRVSNASATVFTANTTKVTFVGANVDATSADLAVNNANITNNLTVTGNTTLGDSTSDRVTVPALVSSNLHPAANATYLLGNNTLRWAEGHFANVHSNTGYFDGDVQIGGSLEVFGNVTTTNVTSVIVSDPMIYLAGNNYAGDLLDIGFAANYFDGVTARHTGLFRDASDGGIYKLFTNSEQELSGNNLVNTAANGFTLAILQTYLQSGGLSSNGTAITITANSSLSVDIIANTLTLSTALAGTEGGTGYKTSTDQSILVGNASNGYDKLTLGTSGYVLQSNGTSLLYDYLDGGSF